MELQELFRKEGRVGKHESCRCAFLDKDGITVILVYKGYVGEQREVYFNIDELKEIVKNAEKKEL